MRNKSEKVTLKVGVWRSEEDKERYVKTIELTGQLLLEMRTRRDNIVTGGNIWTNWKVYLLRDDWYLVWWNVRIWLRREDCLGSRTTLNVADYTILDQIPYRGELYVGHTLGAPFRVPLEVAKAMAYEISALAVGGDKF